MTNSAMPLIAFMVSMLRSVIMHLWCVPHISMSLSAQPPPEWVLQSSWGSWPPPSVIITAGNSTSEARLAGPWYDFAAFLKHHSTMQPIAG
jgi:hypothetical protein